MNRDREHFDPTDCIRANLKENTNDKVVGQCEDDVHAIVMTEFLALNTKVYSINHQTLGPSEALAPHGQRARRNPCGGQEVENKRTLKGGHRDV